MKVLIIGSGGREHALAWKCAQSSDVDAVLVAPGNAGTANEHGCRNVPVSSDDIEALATLAQDEDVGLDAFVIAGERLSRSSQPGLYLVCDH